MKLTSINPIAIQRLVKMQLEGMNRNLMKMNITISRLVVFSLIPITVIPISNLSMRAIVAYRLCQFNIHSIFSHICSYISYAVRLINVIYRVALGICPKASQFSADHNSPRDHVNIWYHYEHNIIVGDITKQQPNYIVIVLYLYQTSQLLKLGTNTMYDDSL
jgi:hypothetical protein